jgi:glycosyltransferase involved in cell wall biosynthesis
MKGLDVLFHVLKLLPADQFHLVLVGRGPDELRLKDLARDLGVMRLVSFVGSVPNKEVCDYLGDADIYVYPSLTEGWPKSVLEAMIMAKPIVASRVHGVTDLLDDNTALLCDPIDASDFASKILTFSNDRELARCLGENAKSKAAALYDKLKEQTIVSDVCL